MSYKTYRKKRQEPISGWVLLFEALRFIALLSRLEPYFHRTHHPLPDPSRGHQTVAKEKYTLQSHSLQPPTLRPFITVNEIDFARNRAQKWNDGSCRCKGL